MAGNLTSISEALDNLEDLEDTWSWKDFGAGFVDTFTGIWEGIKSIKDFVIENWEAIVIAIVIVIAVVVIAILLTPLTLGALIGAAATALSYAGTALTYMSAAFMAKTAVDLVVTGSQTGEWDYACGRGAGEAAVEGGGFVFGKFIKGFKYTDEAADVAKAADNVDEVSDLAKAADDTPTSVKCGLA